MATRITPQLAMRHTHTVGEIAGAMIPYSSFIIRGKNTTISDIIRSSITAALDMRAAASTVVVKLTAAAIVEPAHLLVAHDLPSLSELDPGCADRRRPQNQRGSFIGYTAARARLPSPNGPEKTESLS
jgi:hypothetical protein